MRGMFEALSLEYLLHLGFAFALYIDLYWQAIALISRKLQEHEYHYPGPAMDSLSLRYCIS